MTFEEWFKIKVWLTELQVRYENEAKKLKNTGIEKMYIKKANEIKDFLSTKI